MWAERGSRPVAPRDQRYSWAYLFGAICPARGTGVALVLPSANAAMMNLHLAEISANVAPDAHAVLWACPAFADTSARLKGLEVTMSEDTIRRRSFPEAFKREAVAAIRGGRSVSQVAAELGLADRLVRSWLRWAEEHPAEASGAPASTPSRAQAAPTRRVGPSPADQAAEIARLRKELERVRMERDILKRAALIFGQATDRR